MPGYGRRASASRSRRPPGERADGRRVPGGPGRRSCRSRGRPSVSARRRAARASRQRSQRLLRVLVLVLELADRNQVLHRLEIVDVQLALEVVELMLQRAAEEPRACNLDLLAHPVLRNDPDLLVAGHVRHVAGDRQAALEVAVVARRADDLGVYELVEVALDLDDAGPHRLAQLGGGEADAGRMAHRVSEVVEQLVEVLAEAVDRLALEAETGVAEEDDGSN